MAFLQEKYRILIAICIYAVLCIALGISIKIACVRGEKIDALDAELRAVHAQAEQQADACNHTIESLRRTESHAREVQNAAEKAIKCNPEWAVSPVPDDIRELCDSLCADSLPDAP